jgi:hypothetical protein
MRKVTEDGGFLEWDVMVITEPKIICLISDE